MGFDSLSREVLHDIISCQSPGFTDLQNYSLVCRSTWEVASAIMYRHIDLTIDSRGKEANQMTKRRQLQLLKSIASNPKLGAFVRTFRNYHPWPGGGRREHQDVTMRAEDGIPKILVKAAQNISFLSKASFTANPLAIQVITNLPSYSQLTELSITRLKPEEHIWNIAPTSLKKLTWEASPERSEIEENPWNTAIFLIKVAESTCPHLESLDISFCEIYGFHLPAFPPVKADITSQYQEMQVSTTSKLTRLRHFGFKYQDASAAQQIQLEASFLHFIARHSNTLKSIAIPNPYGPMTRETLEFILKACTSLPHITELIVDAKKVGTSRGGEQIGLHFVMELTSSLASPMFEIERLSIGDIEVPFSPDVGKLFSSLKSLKFLRVGDKDGSEGPYGNDGRLDFQSYGPKVLGFIQELPQSLQELYLEINGLRVWCDEDSDFNPVCDFGSEIFGAMKRMHTCDIHAWISSVGGGLGKIPEKAVFYRRLAHQDDPDNANVKDIWTSRMDCINQGDDTVVVKDCEELEGGFQGEDADEVWCGGYDSEELGPTSRGRQADRPDYSWPGRVNKVNEYAMFKAKS